MEDKYTWNEYAIYVLKTLEALDKKISTVSDKIDTNKDLTSKEIKDLRDDIAGLKSNIGLLKERINIRSSVFGSLGSAITLAIFLIVQLLIKK